jgi:hypothetical protein
VAFFHSQTLSPIIEASQLMKSMSYRSINTKVFFLAALVSLVSVANRAGAEEIDAVQVLKEVRSGIVRLEASEAQLKSWKVGLSGDVFNRMPGFTIKKHEKSVIMECGNRKIKIIKNDSEVFVAKPAFLNQEWALARYFKSDKDREWKKWNHDLHFQLEPLLAVSESSTILNILDDHTFTPKRARVVVDDHVELDYEYTLPALETATGKVVSCGTFTFAPELDWLVIQSITRSTGNPWGTVDFAMERDAVREGDRIRVLSIKCNFVNPGKRSHAGKSEYTYKTLPSETVDPSEFTLEHYNLAAPEDDVLDEAHLNFNYPVWGSIGVIYVSLSGGIGWLVRRRRAA